MYFSAVYNDPDSGDVADHYRLQVNKESDFSGRMMWDSGKTAMSNVDEGSRCDDITYVGQALSLNKIKYYWRIKFWDDEGNEGVWSAVANFTMAGSGVGEAGAGPWGEDVVEPTGEAKLEKPRRSGNWTALDDVMRIHTSVNKNPLDAIEIAQAEVTCSNIDKHFNSFNEASDWYKSLEGYAVQLSVGCKVGGTPITEKLFTGIISSADAVRLSQTAEIRVVDFLDYFGRVTIEATPIWQNISLTQLYKNLVELAFPEWVEGVDYFVEDLGDISVPAICYQKLNLLSELKHIAESRGMRIFTDVNGKLVCRNRSLEGEPWDIKHDYNLESVQERRDINKVYNWIIVHARPHEIGYEPTSETPGTVDPGVPVFGPDVTPPGKIAGFTATPKDQGYDLSWSNPWNADFELVRILSNSSASTGAQYPLFPEYKAPIYEGTGESFSKGSIANGQRIFFSAFTKDTTGNWSEAAHASCVVGAGGDTWGDNTGTSEASAFRAQSESGRIVLTWRNPSVANFDKVVVRRSTTSYPSSPTSGASVYDGTAETKIDSSLNNGQRYYYSLFVRNTASKWSNAIFASAVPAGLKKVLDTEVITGYRDGGGIYFSSYSKIVKLKFPTKAKSSGWLKFRHAWDIETWCGPKYKSNQRHEIGLQDDLSLSFSGSIGVVNVRVTKISYTATCLTVQYNLALTATVLGIKFRNKLSLIG